MKSRYERVAEALSMAEEKAQEWGELSIYAGMDAFMSYFFTERIGMMMLMVLTWSIWAIS
jgi:hypothetical protein